MKTRRHVPASAGFLREKAMIRASVLAGKEEEGVKYKDYFAWERASQQDPIAPDARPDARRQGVLLAVHILPEEKEALAILEDQCVKHANRASEQVKMAVHDSYNGFLAPSMEHEMQADAKRKSG